MRVSKTKLSARIFPLIMMAMLAALPGAVWAQAPRSKPAGKAPRVFSIPFPIMQQVRDQIAAGKLKDPSFDQLGKDGIERWSKRPCR